MSNEPVLIAYTVKKGAVSGKEIWSRTAAAWSHDKGAGLTLIIETPAAKIRWAHPPAGAEK
jgi:hypothetical protein